MPITNDLLQSRVKGLINEGLLTKEDYGLGNVLTSNQVNTSLGVAGLDANLKISASQIPPISINSLNDVQLSGVGDAQILAYDGASQKWKNTTNSSSGSGTLNQTEIVVGVGDASTNPQSVTLRGPVGTGTSVEPGNLVLQPPIGTGSWGSGNTIIRGADQNTISMPCIALASAYTSATFHSLEITLPTVSEFRNISIILHIITRGPTSSTPAISGITFTQLFATTIAQSLGMSVYYAQNISGSGLKNLTLTHDASATVAVYACFLESAAIPSTPITTTFSSATTSAVTISPTPNASDLCFDIVLYGTNTTNAPLDTTPTGQTIIEQTSSASFGGTSPYSFYSISYGQANSVMSRTYSSAVSGKHMAYRISSQRPATSASVISSDVLYVKNGTVISRPFPIKKSETTNMAPFLIKFLKPDSSRYQLVTSSLTTGTPYRTIIMPRADCLPLGTQFVFYTHSNTVTQIYIAPYSVKMLTLSSSDRIYSNPLIVVAHLNSSTSFA